MSSRQVRRRPRQRGEAAYIRAYGPESREVNRMLRAAALEQGMAYPIDYRAVQNALAAELDRQVENWQAAEQQEMEEEQTTVRRRRGSINQFPGGNYRQPYYE